MFEFETRVVGGRLVLAVAGDLDLASAPTFRRAGVAAVAEGCDVVADLTACDHLDSVGVGLLLGIHKRLRPLARTLTVVCDEPRVLRVLELTEIDRIVPVVDRLEQVDGGASPAAAPVAPAPEGR